MRVAGTIVAQREYFGRGEERAGRAKLAIAVLIDIIAEVQDCIYVVALGKVFVAVEKALRKVGTRDDGEAYAIGIVADRQSFGSSAYGVDVVCLKFVIIERVGLQARNIDFNSEIYAAIGGNDARIYGVEHGCIGGDAPFYIDAGGVGRYACPKYDSIRKRVARCNAMIERSHQSPCACTVGGGAGGIDANLLGREISRAHEGTESS